MEPGGIEPPSRDSQQDASTRVVDRLISASHRGSTPCASAQPLETSSPARQEAPRADQPDDRDLPAPSGVRREIRGFIKPRVRTAVRQLWVACFLRGRHAPRRATPSLPYPVECHIGPSMRKRSTRQPCRSRLVGDPTQHAGVGSRAIRARPGRPPVPSGWPRRRREGVLGPPESGQGDPFAKLCFRLRVFGVDLVGPRGVSARLVDPVLTR